MEMWAPWEVHLFTGQPMENPRQRERVGQPIQSAVKTQAVQTQAVAQTVPNHFDCLRWRNCISHSHCRSMYTRHCINQYGK